MIKTTTPTAPVEEPLDAEVLEFRAGFESRSPLDEIVREGAQRMLQAAIDAEVGDFIAQHSDRRDDQNRRLIVRNGRLPSREILSGAGRLEVSQPRVRKVFPETAEQRCWFHKSGNVLSKMPRSVQPRAKRDLHEIWQADTRDAANKAFDNFLEKLRRKISRRL